MLSSIIIPVHNHAFLTQLCLNALVADSSLTDHEIVVVDDGSSDVTPEMLAAYGDRVRTLRHEKVLGFGNSCNDGALAATGDHLVFLNNDTIPMPGWLEALHACARRHEFPGALGAKLLFPNGTIQHAGVAICGDRFPRHIYAGFPAEHPAVNRERAYPAVTGACLFVSRSVFLDHDGFDPRFHNGYEDVDLCLRLGEAGYGVFYCPESVVYHFESMTRVGQDYTENVARWRERWYDRVRPDEFDYYVADGLVRVEHGELFPCRIEVDPLLAATTPEGSGDLDDLLLRRARENHELLRENLRLAGLNGRGQAALPPPTAAPEELPAPPEILNVGRLHTLGGSGQLVSVLLPVRNGEPYLPTLLDTLLAQDLDCRLEIVATDSASDDASREILDRYGARLIAVDPRAFNHGATRQLLAEHAHGEVLVFLSQHALPGNEKMLRSLVRALDSTPDVAGVCCRVLPRDEADPLTTRDGLNDLSASSERSIRRITDRRAYDALSPHELRVFVNFHTVGAAIRRSVLTVVPFRPVSTLGEDVQWARDVLEAGYAIQHEPSAVVRHSHEYTSFEVFTRNVDDGRANRDIVGRTLGDDELLPLTHHLIQEDWSYLGTLDLDEAELERLRIDAVILRIAQVTGQWVGVNGPDMDGNLSEMFSAVRRARARAVAAR